MNGNLISDSTSTQEASNRVFRDVIQHHARKDQHELDDSTVFLWLKTTKALQEMLPEPRKYVCSICHESGHRSTNHELIQAERQSEREMIAAIRNLEWPEGVRIPDI